jgi:hypothetical protein
VSFGHRYKTELIPSAYGRRFIKDLVQLEHFLPYISIEHVDDDKEIRWSRYYQRIGVHTPAALLRLVAPAATFCSQKLILHEPSITWYARPAARSCRED